jgi:hypothetical protein
MDCEMRSASQGINSARLVNLSAPLRLALSVFSAFPESSELWENPAPIADPTQSSPPSDQRRLASGAESVRNRGLQRGLGYGQVIGSASECAWIGSVVFAARR